MQCIQNLVPPEESASLHPSYKNVHCLACTFSYPDHYCFIPTIDHDLEDPPALLSVLLQLDTGRITNIKTWGKTICPKEFIYHISENKCIIPKCTFPKTLFNGTCTTLPIVHQMSDSVSDIYSFLQG